jgi:S1-C subfamily serine protease
LNSLAEIFGQRINTHILAKPKTFIGGGRMALIPPSYLDCVVAIGVPNEEDKPFWVASGFLYGYFVEITENGQQAYDVYLVTNRHVFEGRSKVYLRFNPVGSEAARQYLIDIVDNDGKPIWRTDENPDIDVAIVQIDAQSLQAEGIQFSVFQSDKHCANTQMMEELGITEGDFVYVLGFPMGLVGGERNFVIVRSGIVARVRDAIAHVNNEFLIDTFIFPGNSGGPVVSKPEVTSIRGTRSQNKAYLIGVVTGYIPYKDIAVSQQTGKPRIIFEENSGLAAVHPIDFVGRIITSQRSEVEDQN